MEFGDAFLREVGLLAMPTDEKEAFLAYVQEELEVRVGEEIAEGMTEEKMKEFEDAQSDEEAVNWLKENKPNYREIVKNTVNELKEEISRNRDKLLGN